MNIHFVGVGGISMSALAKILLSRGNVVSGSDLTENVQTKELRDLGCRIFIGHHADNISGADYVVINGAVGAGNAELAAARANNIPVIMRDKLLADISKEYREVIAVAGCHGKSTTTAMIGGIWTESGLDPTIHNGAIMNKESNLRLGGGEYFITEACEFKRSFLALAPTIAVVTNVDADHLDCYTDINDIKSAFAEFCGKSGIVIKNADDPNSYELTGRQKTVSFGIDSGDVHCKNLRLGIDGKYSFDIVLNEKIFGKLPQNFTVKLGVPGRHNVYNALCSVSAALCRGIDLRFIISAITNYRGISRRFEYLKTINNTPIILDYAHHPNEIKTTIDTANLLYTNYLLVFQPHTFTRTLALFDDFVSVLSRVKNLALYKTYAAREKPIKGGRANDLVSVLRKSNKKIKYFANTVPLQKYIENITNQYDAIILCGAGDVVSGEFLDAVEPPK
jgi:UDP-N-acetylmuramate--alanine ligase